MIQLAKRDSRHEANVIQEAMLDVMTVVTMTVITVVTIGTTSRPLRLKMFGEAADLLSLLPTYASRSQLVDCPASPTSCNGPGDCGTASRVVVIQSMRSLKRCRAKTTVKVSDFPGPSIHMKSYKVDIST